MKKKEILFKKNKHSCQAFGELIQFKKYDLICEWPKGYLIKSRQAFWEW